MKMEEDLKGKIERLVNNAILLQEQALNVEKKLNDNNLSSTTLHRYDIVISAIARKTSQYIKDIKDVLKDFDNSDNI